MSKIKLLLLLVLAMNIIACGNDDDGFVGTLPVSPVAGSWALTAYLSVETNSAVTYSADNGEVIDSTGSIETETLVSSTQKFTFTEYPNFYNTEGTYSFTITSDNSSSSTFASDSIPEGIWAIVGDTLMFTILEETTPRKFFLKEQSDTEMLLEQSESVLVSTPNGVGDIVEQRSETIREWTLEKE